MIRTTCALLAVCGMTMAAVAADWPAWRGPTGQGYCEETGLPLTWSKTENVKWKVPLENQGNSTPVVWGNRIFLTQANQGGTVRGVLCLDCADGKLLWQRDVPYDDKERNWNASWYCNASPVTDGERVIVCFSSAGLYCFDYDGKEIWKRTDLGKWEHVYGNGASPVLHGDLVIQWCGPNEGKGRNWLLAVNKKTGETVWEHDEKGGSWSTPLIAQVGGQDQMILGVPNRLKGLDPKTGNELWFCDGLTQLVYTSALYDNGTAVAMSGYGGAALAVKLGGSGDITSQRLWHHPRNTQRVGSGIIVGDHVYILEESGVPHCYELATGNEVWKVEKRPGGGSWSSMIHAEGRLYVLSKQADTYVFAASPNYELLATNPLGDQTNSSIAVSNGELFIRTFKSLWCIGEEKGEEDDEEESDDPAGKQVELKQGDRIIFFGDSLTALAGQEAPKQHVTKGYVRIVRETLQAKHKDKNIEVDWVATGGHTVPDLLKRVDKDVIAKKPTIVVVQIGCNDARRIPKDTFENGLKELIDKLQAANIQVIQCSLTSVGEKHDGTNKDDPKLDEFAQIQRQVARAKNVPLNDLRKAFVAHWKQYNADNKPSGILTYDGNHFNDAGHQFVAEQMLGKFK